MKRYSQLWVQVIRADCNIWPNSFQDLFFQFNAAEADETYGHLLQCFLIQVMLTLHSEIVDRIESKEVFDIQLASRLKDCIRANAIKDIITVLNEGVLARHATYTELEVENTLNVFA